MTSFIAAGGSGRSTSFIPAVPAAWSVTTITFMGIVSWVICLFGGNLAGMESRSTSPTRAVGSFRKRRASAAHGGGDRGDGDSQRKDKNRRFSAQLRRDLFPRIDEHVGRDFFIRPREVQCCSHRRHSARRKARTA